MRSARKWEANGWCGTAGADVANRDLWEMFRTFSKENVITASWVRGHTGEPHNERCDELAQRAAANEAARARQTP
jgi:ribonuclease HI